ncbi:MAG: c-type cytochrome [Gemmatimonadota bacterium]
MHRHVYLPLLLVATLAPARPAAAQGWSWPERAENLQDLPADFPPNRLRAVMTGFTRSLGVRCSYCHVGEEGQPLSTYDFPSDEKVQKRTAREMLRLLGSVNEHLGNIEPTGEKVNMWCFTCHAGRARPQVLEEALMETYRAEGIDAAVAKYGALRERYYGRGAYNFSERSLNVMGYQLLREGDHEGAIRIFHLNTEHNPESANVWDSLAEGYMTAGMNGPARIFYRKSLELNPQNQNAIDKLAEIDAAEEATP